MQIKIQTPKGRFNAGQNWTGYVDKFQILLKEFFNTKRLDTIAEIIRQGVVDDIDAGRKPRGGKLRALKPLTLKYKRGTKLNETGKLRSEISWIRKGKTRVVKVIGEREDVGGYLQFGTSRMEAFNWFGVSRITRTKVKDYVESEWNKTMKKVG